MVLATHLDVAADLGAASVIVISVPPLAPSVVPRHPIAVLLRSSTWGVEAHGRTTVARPPHGLLVIEIPSQPSTVVDCTGRAPRVIRPGAIPAAALRESAPDLVGDA